MLPWDFHNLNDLRADTQSSQTSVLIFKIKISPPQPKKFNFIGISPKIDTIPVTDQILTTTKRRNFHSTHTTSSAKLRSQSIKNFPLENTSQRKHTIDATKQSQTSEANKPTFFALNKPILFVFGLILGTTIALFIIGLKNYFRL